MRRQAERRQDIIDVLRTKGYTRVVDLSGEETSGRYLEGTGVLVLDRINGVAYVSLSERANKVWNLSCIPQYVGWSRRCCTAKTTNANATLLYVQTSLHHLHSKSC